MVARCLDQRMLNVGYLVNTAVDDRLRAGEPSLYVNRHPGQLSLGILLWVGAMNTGGSWLVDKYSTRSTIYTVSQKLCKIVLSELHQISTNFDIFHRKIAKRLKFREV